MYVLCMSSESFQWKFVVTFSNRHGLATCPWFRSWGRKTDPFHISQRQFHCFLRGGYNVQQPVLPLKMGGSMVDMSIIW